MSWQLGVVLVLIAAAGAYLLRATWTTWAGKPGCGSCGGGCAKPEAAVPTAKGRRGLPMA